MEDQLVHGPVGTPAKLHTMAHKLGNHERSRLMGDQLVGWLTGQCKEELSVGVLVHRYGHSWAIEGANALLAEGCVRAVAGRNTGEDDVFDQRLKRGCQRRDVSVAIRGK